MEEEILRNECWDKRFYSFGTSKIFEKRANKLKILRNIITFLGLVVPLSVGGTVLAFSVSSDLFKNFIVPIAGILTVSQLIISLWSLIARWDERHDYAVTAIRANTKLASAFERLGNSKFEVVSNEIDNLREEYIRQEAMDSIQNITAKEYRFAMRQSLFQYKLKCKTCEEVPKSLKPTDCDTCGNY
jgi:mobilome CxxCx(11)CxxC protein